MYRRAVASPPSLLPTTNDTVRLSASKKKPFGPYKSSRWTSARLAVVRLFSKLPAKVGLLLLLLLLWTIGKKFKSYPQDFVPLRLASFVPLTPLDGSTRCQPALLSREKLDKSLGTCGCTLCL